MALFGRRILGQYPAAPSSPGHFVLLVEEGESLLRKTLLPSKESDVLQTAAGGLRSDQVLLNPYPDLPFLAFFEFLAFFLSEDFLAFFSVFPFFSRDFRGRLRIRNPCFFGGFPCRVPKEQGKEDQGNPGARQKLFWGWCWELFEGPQYGLGNTCVLKWMMPNKRCPTEPIKTQFFGKGQGGLGYP